LKEAAVRLICYAKLRLHLPLSAGAAEWMFAWGYTGGDIMGGKEEKYSAELSSSMALPYAIFRHGGEHSEIRPSAELSKTELPQAKLPQTELPQTKLPLAELPQAPPNTGILVLALPRTFTDSALERFKGKREPRQEIQIIFLENTETKKDSYGIGE
jgi:hypothetical protein